MTQQQPQRLGWEEVERLEFMKVLKAPLLVQTPLQVLMEQLFARVQSQANMYSEMQRRIERIEARDMSGEELLGRIRLCEDALAGINHAKLSPFHQQEVLGRLELLEAQVHDLSQRPTAPEAAAGAAAGTPRGDRDSSKLSRMPSVRSLGDLQGVARTSAAATLTAAVEMRLQALEGKLAGVYNLGGHLLAVDQMATELGVEVPDCEYTPAEASAAAATGGAAQGDGAEGPSERGVTFRPTASNAAGDAAAQAALASGASPKAATLIGRLQANQSAAGSSAHNSRPGSPTTRGPGEAGSSGGATLQRSGTALRLGEVASQVEEVREDVDDVKELLQSLQQSMASLHGGMLTERDALTLRVAALEASSVEMRENLMTEIANVQKQARREPEVAFADFSALSSQVSSATTALAALTSAVEGVRDTQVPAMKEQLEDLKDQVKRSSEAREMDTLFHTRIAKLEGVVGDMKSEVQLAVQDIMQDVARLSDIQALEDAVEQCATAADVKQLAAQQAALAHSVGGMADWLAMRPDTADGAKNTGASATRFKCLTCDREIKSQGTPPENTKARGTFLPKLEGLQASHQGVPMGPGLNAGELRRLAEERTAGRKGSPIRGAELDDYGADVAAARSKGGRTVIAMPPSAIMPKVQPGAHRTPVFI